MGSPSSTSVPTAPDRDQGRGGVALLIVDVINCFDFTGGDALKQNAQAIIDPILALRGQVDEADAPVIYVNDNFGEWHSEKSKLIGRAKGEGGELIHRLEPREQDYFIIKPQLSGFYATNLPVLLPKLGVSRLILTGIAADMCVLFTAGDAHMRDYAVWVPADAVAGEKPDRMKDALDIMHAQLGAEIAATSELDLTTWLESLDCEDGE